MEPQDFFRIARGLPNSDEAGQRSAVNRIYYGAHHEVLRQYNLRAPRRGRHTWLTDQLLGEGQAARQLALNREAGRQLKRLKASRELADYEINAGWSGHLVTEAWELAHRLVNSLPRPFVLP